MEDDRDSQDGISILPPSHTSRVPSTAPSRTHSMSNTPQTIQSPVEEHPMASTLMSSSLSTDQLQGNMQPDGYTKPPAPNTPQTIQSTVQDRSMASTLVRRSLSTGQLQDDRQMDGYFETPTSKKPKRSSSHSHPSTHQMSPNPSNASHHTVATQPQIIRPQSRNQGKLFNFHRPMGLRLYKVKE